MGRYTGNKPVRSIRILLEVDGKQTPILFHRYEGGQAIKVEDPQYTHHMNNVDDAVRDALDAIGFQIYEGE